MELPGQELVERGLADLRRGDKTVEALLVSIAAPRLRATGLDVPEPLPDPELSLYELLRREHGDDAHGRYNALVRRLVSYERAAECAR
ncbi:MAG: hypothetical protein H0T61_08740 [Actinobacteria bacterium]|nr:hypothetical protein [Actinomycetota bacterium]